jgi:hypothetical protein
MRTSSRIFDHINMNREDYTTGYSHSLYNLINRYADEVEPISLLRTG